MKKTISFLYFLVLTASLCSAQKKPQSLDIHGNSIYYTASNHRSIGISVTIDSNTKWIEYHNPLSNQPLTNYVFMEGAKQISIFTYLPEDSLWNYRYNIIENDSIWLATSANPNLLAKSSARKIHDNKSQIDLGRFNIDNKKLTIEMYKLSEKSRVSTVIIYNKPIEPPVLMYTFIGVSTKKGDAVKLQNQPDGFEFKIQDSLTVNRIMLSIKNSDMSFVYHVYIKKLTTGENIHVSNNWLYDYGPLPHLWVDSHYFSSAGEYEISIIPKLNFERNAKAFSKMAVKIRFTVLRSGKYFSKKEVTLLIFITAVVIALNAILIILSNKKKNRLAVLDEQKQKESAQIQLSAVQSQLNPHFLFNALSGIQNLMNKNETDQANRYLAKFARLTRSVLSNHELISIADEKSLLDDYLQMEQFRFKFNYQIILSEGLDPANTEIPAMLLQPFVENAVKHGISTLGEDGNIRIAVSKEERNLILSVTDNGPGFDTQNSKQGLGFDLSLKRIALLNKVYKDSPVSLKKESKPSKTTVTIILSQWL